jgi:hypothetical protein
LTTVATGNASSGTPQSVTKSPGWTYMGAYEPRNPRSLDEIPEPIKVQVVAHLKARLGEDFYRRLGFSGGQIVDIEELHRINPDSYNYRWEVHAFDLHFTFHMPEIGLDSYSAQIKLRPDGSVLHEIDLPNFTADPSKLRFITLAAALQVAQSKGFKINKVSAEIAYDTKADALVWRLSEVAHDDGLNILYKNIDIYAHTGSVAKVYETEAIR